MQTEAEAFLQRIRAYPDDDTQRLIFADWLDEEGDPRGRFIRVQLALAELSSDNPARMQLQTEERALLSAHRDEWEAPLRRLSATGCEFRRGFIDELKVEAKQFLRHDHELFAASPVRHIHLHDVNESLPTVLQSAYLSRLAALTIHAQYSGEPLARAVARSEHLAGLKRLTLSRNRLGDDAAEQLALSPNLANLEELDLSENEIGETGARNLAASPHLSKLHRLEIGGNHLGPAGAEALACSERLASLGVLGLPNNDIGLPRLLTLSRAHALLRIPVLDLANNGLTAAGLQAILSPPAGTTPSTVRLRELDLTGNEQLGDNGARVIANCPHLRNLTLLRLAHCGIGDEGTRALANCQYLTEVVELNLENNPIGDSGFRPFLSRRYWNSLCRLLPPWAGPTTWMRGELDKVFNRPIPRK